MKRKDLDVTMILIGVLAIQMMNKESLKTSSSEVRRVESAKEAGEASGVKIGVSVIKG